MENGWNWEQRTLVSELIQGMELAKQLRVQLCMASSVESRDLLVQRILASYEKALLILKWSGPMGHQLHPVGPTGGVPESPISINGSPRSEDVDGIARENQDQKDASKKRKTMPRWTDHVKVSSESGLEGPHDDGYSWRKYGQKDILGAKYPRSYYRCTYRNTQNCWATKQVQRSDEDPTIFEVTYRGTHACFNGNQSVPPPASPEKQEQKQNNNLNDNHQQQQSLEVLLNFRKDLRVQTEDLDNKEMPRPFSFASTSFGHIKGDNQVFLPSMPDNNSLLTSFSPTFIPPTTPEPSYIPVLPYQMNHFGGANNVHHSESDLTEIISANNSATNSPIVDLHFSTAEIDPNFPFDMPGFFS